MLVNEDLPSEEQARELASLKAKLAKAEADKQSMAKQLAKREAENESVNLEELKQSFATQERLLGAYQVSPFYLLSTASI